MNPVFAAALALLLGGLFVSLYFRERSLKLLSPEEKLKLLDSFSRLRAFGALPMLLIVFSFFGITYLPRQLMWPAYFAAWAFIAIYFVIVHLYVFRKMREFGINPAYLAAQSKARWISYGGIGAFFILNTLAPFLWR
jgi:hypothetical protein